MKRPFTKMQGTGNDYIYIDCTKQSLDNPEEVSRRLSDRHFGIGGDGLILILPSQKGDFRMRMFNADGSEAEMCGNGLRCFGKYVYERKLTKKTDLTIETKAGLLNVFLEVDQDHVKSVTVDMGQPELEPKIIPVTMDGERVIDKPFSIENHQFNITALSMGNPHCVIPVEKITDDHILTLGPLIEHHSLFPNRVNVEFITFDSDNEITMRVWERGSGETLACGTGAAAVGVAGVLLKKTQRKTTVHLKGGDLVVEWKENNHVFLTGPAEFVFDGEVELS